MWVGCLFWAAEVHHMTFELIPDATSPREAKDSTQEEEQSEWSAAGLNWTNDEKRCKAPSRTSELCKYMIIIDNICKL